MQKQLLRWTVIGVIGAVVIVASGTPQAPTRAFASAASDKPDKPSSKKDKKSKKKKRRSGKKAKARGDHPFPKGQREKEFSKALGESYRVLYTDHFVVLTDADEAVVRDFLPRLEKTYDSVHRFVTKMKIKIEYPKEKLPVLFCHDFDEYSARCEQFTGRPAPGDAAGLYWRAPLNFSIFYDMSKVDFILDLKTKADNLRKQAAQASDRNVKKQKLREANWYVNRIDIYQQEQNRSVVQHEVAHQLLFNLDFHKHDADNPQWFVEGMATLFEPPPGKTGAGFNVINQDRLGEVRDGLEAVTPDEFKAFIGSPSGGGMLSSHGYARSWSICYYLVKRKRKALPKYVELIKKRKSNERISPGKDVEDFEKCFGKIDRVFTKKYAHYITHLPYMPSQ